MTASPTHSARPRRKAWLLLIACFKLLEALLFVGVGIGALHLIHVDIDDFLAQVFEVLRLNPESHWVNFLLVKASILDEHMLRRISAIVFVYAGLALVEGVGLYLEKVWAEYLTIVLTASFLPFEAIHLFHHPTWPRAVLLLLNALMFLYLLRDVVGEQVHKARLRAVQ